MPEHSSLCKKTATIHACIQPHLSFLCCLCLLARVCCTRDTICALSAGAGSVRNQPSDKASAAEHLAPAQPFVVGSLETHTFGHYTWLTRLHRQAHGRYEQLDIAKAAACFHLHGLQGMIQVMPVPIGSFGCIRT